MNLETVSTRRIIADLRQALDTVASLGVDWKQTRFSQYLTILEGASEGWRTPTFGTPEDRDGERRHWEAVGQAVQLAAAAQAWPSLDREQLRQKLRLVFKGSALPPTGSGDDKPRNTLLELTTAALLRRRGLEIELTPDREDVRAGLPGHGVFALECKRPAHTGNLERNLRKVRRPSTLNSAGWVVSNFLAQRELLTVDYLHRHQGFPVEIQVKARQMHRAAVIVEYYQERRNLVLFRGFKQLWFKRHSGGHEEHIPLQTMQCLERAMSRLKNNADRFDHDLMAFFLIGYAIGNSCHPVTVCTQDDAAELLCRLAVFHSIVSYIWEEWRHLDGVGPTPFQWASRFVFIDDSGGVKREITFHDLHNFMVRQGLLVRKS